MDDQLVENARSQAVASIENNNLNKLKKTIENVVQNHDVPSLEPVKQILRKIAHPRMRTCTFYCCDECNNPILDDNEGFIIHGNVYVANTECRGGIIGNNFPDVTPGTQILLDDIQENVFCKHCLIQILRLTDVLKDKQTCDNKKTQNSDYQKRSDKRNRSAEWT